MTEQELSRIKTLQTSFASIDAIAGDLKMHKDTLRRRLLKENGIVIEAVNACRLTPLSDKLAEKKEEGK